VDVGLRSLPTIPPLGASCPQLQRVWLSCNALSGAFPPAAGDGDGPSPLRGLSRLSSLCLRQNRIARLDAPRLALDLPALASLSLGGNRLRRLDGLAALRGLTELQAPGNALERPPSASSASSSAWPSAALPSSSPLPASGAAASPALRVLNVAGNPSPSSLRELGGLAASFPGLEELWLADPMWASAGGAAAAGGGGGGGGGGGPSADADSGQGQCPAAALAGYASAAMAALPAGLKLLDGLPVPDGARAAAREARRRSRLARSLARRELERRCFGGLSGGGLGGDGGDDDDQAGRSLLARAAAGVRLAAEHWDGVRAALVRELAGAQAALAAAEAAAEAADGEDGDGRSVPLLSLPAASRALCDVELELSRVRHRQHEQLQGALAAAALRARRALRRALRRAALEAGTHGSARVEEGEEGDAEEQRDCGGGGAGNSACSIALAATSAAAFASALAAARTRDLRVRSAARVRSRALCLAFEARLGGRLLPSGTAYFGPATPAVAAVAARGGVVPAALAAEGGGHVRTLLYVLPDAGEEETGRRARGDGAAAAAGRAQDPALQDDDDDDDAATDDDREMEALEAVAELGFVGAAAAAAASSRPGRRRRFFSGGGAAAARPWLRLLSSLPTTRPGQCLTVMVVRAYVGAAGSGHVRLPQAEGGHGAAAAAASAAAETPPPLSRAGWGPLPDGAVAAAVVVAAGAPEVWWHRDPSLVLPVAILELSGEDGDAEEEEGVAAAAAALRPPPCSAAAASPAAPLVPRAVPSAHSLRVATTAVRRELEPWVTLGDAGQTTLLPPPSASLAVADAAAAERRRAPLSAAEAANAAALSHLRRLRFAAASPSPAPELPDSLLALECLSLAGAGLAGSLAGLPLARLTRLRALSLACNALESLFWAAPAASPAPRDAAAEHGLVLPPSLVYLDARHNRLASLAGGGGGGGRGGGGGGGGGRGADSPPCQQRLPRLRRLLLSGNALRGAAETGAALRALGLPEEAAVDLELNPLCEERGYPAAVRDALGERARLTPDRRQGVGAALVALRADAAERSARWRDRSAAAGTAAATGTAAAAATVDDHDDHRGFVALRPFRFHVTGACGRARLSASGNLLEATPASLEAFFLAPPDPLAPSMPRPPPQLPLVALDLSGNRLAGAAPDLWGALESASRLTRLELGGNQLTGFPPEEEERAAACAHGPSSRLPPPPQPRGLRCLWPLLPALRILGLESNALTSLEGIDRVAGTALERLHARGNPALDSPAAALSPLSPAVLSAPAPAAATAAAVAGGTRPPACPSSSPPAVTASPFPRLQVLDLRDSAVSRGAGVPEGAVAACRDRQQQQQPHRERQDMPRQRARDYRLYALHLLLLLTPPGDPSAAPPLLVLDGQAVAPPERDEAALAFRGVLTREALGQAGRGAASDDDGAERLAIPGSLSLRGWRLRSTGGVFLKAAVAAVALPRPLPPPAPPPASFACSLVDLDLSGNRLDAINPHLAGLVALTRLVLDDNRLGSSIAAVGGGGGGGGGGHAAAASSCSPQHQHQHQHQQQQQQHALSFELTLPSGARAPLLPALASLSLDGNGLASLAPLRLGALGRVLRRLSARGNALTSLGGRGAGAGAGAGEDAASSLSALTGLQDLLLDRNRLRRWRDTAAVLEAVAAAGTGGDDHDDDDGGSGSGSGYGSGCGSRGPSRRPPLSLSLSENGIRSLWGMPPLARVWELRIGEARSDRVLADPRDAEVLAAAAPALRSVWIGGGGEEEEEGGGAGAAPAGGAAHPTEGQRQQRQQQMQQHRVLLAARCGPGLELVNGVRLSQPEREAALAVTAAERAAVAAATQAVAEGGDAAASASAAAAAAAAVVAAASRALVSYS